jgi:hypothetical protein
MTSLSMAENSIPHSNGSFSFHESIHLSPTFSSSFSKFPGEIRNEIYRQLLVCAFPLRRPHRLEQADHRFNIHILLLTKAIYEECLPILYGENHFITSHNFTTQPVQPELWPTRTAPLSLLQLSLIRSVTFCVQASWDADSFLELYELWKERKEGEVKSLVVDVHLPNLTGMHLVCMQKVAPVKEQLSALFRLRGIGKVSLAVRGLGCWCGDDLENVAQDLERQARAMEA